MSKTNDYRACIQDSLEFIDEHLGDKFSAADVASSASFSEYHFHRLFPAFMGESIHQYVRCRRLEKAAKLLVEQPRIRLIDVAIEVGFETHSAFTRAFKQHFGVSPSQFDKSSEGGQAALSRPSSIPTLADADDLVPGIQSLSSLYFAFQIAKGTSAGHFFSELRPDAELANLFQRYGNELIGAVSAFPMSPKSLNDASAEVWYGGLFAHSVRDEQWNHSFQIGAGRWAVFEYEGAYEYLHQVWNQVYRGWLPNSAQSLRDTLPFEMYLNSPQEVAPAELLTQIWLPIE